MLVLKPGPKLPSIRLGSQRLAAIGLWCFAVGHLFGDEVTVVNIIPNSMSSETNQDSEPHLAVNPENRSEIAASSSFRTGREICSGIGLAPIFVSITAGATWNTNCILPGDENGIAGDITLSFAGQNRFFAGILRHPDGQTLNILRTTNFLGSQPMSVLAQRDGEGVDQPFIHAITVGGHDRVYVANNDLNGHSRTATVDLSLKAESANPNFLPSVLEASNTNGQDWPSVRVAAHPKGTVYAAFLAWRSGTLGMNQSDLMVVRDDASGAGGFGALRKNGTPGIRIVTSNMPFDLASHPELGQESLGPNLSIAVDPARSRTVYIAWGDLPEAATSLVLHVRCSRDRGVHWSSEDLRTISNAINPSLAIASDGTVGFLYQQVVVQHGVRRWVTHLERTTDGFTRIQDIQDIILANVPADEPLQRSLPYIGDYDHLLAVGADFYGIFSTSNTPDKCNFPAGVIYQRNADFKAKTLLGIDNLTPVDASIDPFFFHVKKTPKNLPPQTGCPDLKN
jgi:hypothetical protein